MSPIVRKPTICIYENKDADQLAVTAKLISTFVFATWIVHSLFFLNPKFQASNHLLWLHSLVCVGPGWKPRRPVFSHRGSKNVPLMLPVLNFQASSLPMSIIIVGVGGAEFDCELFPFSMLPYFWLIKTNKKLLMKPVAIAKILHWLHASWKISSFHWHHNAMRIKN